MKLLQMAGTLKQEKKPIQGSNNKNVFGNSPHSCFKILIPDIKPPNNHFSYIENAIANRDEILI